MRRRLSSIRSSFRDPAEPLRKVPRPLWSTAPLKNLNYHQLVVSPLPSLAVVAGDEPEGEHEGYESDQDPEWLPICLKPGAQRCSQKISRKEKQQRHHIDDGGRAQNGTL